MKDFKCKYCGKIFNDKRKLAGHITHCKLNPNYEVNLKKCKQNISNANNKINKSNELRDDLFCIYCGKQCKNLNSLKNHERLCKENPDRQILVSNFIKWNEYRAGKHLQKMSNQYIKAKETGDIYLVSDETRKKLSDAAKERVYTKEHREKLSKKMKEVAKDNPNYSFAKNKYFKKEIINGFRMDSSWESIFANYLNKNNIKWIKNKKSFKYIFENEEHSYYPDFYLEDFNLYVEIKGQETEKDKAKYKVVDNLLVLKAKEINEIQHNSFNIFEYINE